MDEQSLFMPMPVLVSNPKDGQCHVSARLFLDNICRHVSARLFLDNICRESMALTGSVCLTACSRTPGTVVYNLIGKTGRKDNSFRTEHPIRHIPI